MSEAYMYKNRTCDKIVTVERKEEGEKVKFEVKFDENKLKSIDNEDERFTKFKQLVDNAVNNLKKNLNTYAENDFLKDLYTYPEKIQELKNEFKQQLTELEEKRKLNRTEKRTLKKARKSLDSIKTFNKEAKKVAADDFGVMTARTINNAIASWVRLFGISKARKNRWKIHEYLHEGRDHKDMLTYWEDKLNYLANFEGQVDESEINKVKSIVDNKKEELLHSAPQDVNNMNKMAIRQFVSKLEEARKDIGVNKKESSSYARLGMMKLCWEVIHTLKSHEKVNQLNNLESTSRKVGEKIFNIGLGLTLSTVGVICIGTMIGLLGIATPLFLPEIMLGLTAVVLGATCFIPSCGMTIAGGGLFDLGKSAGKRMLGTKKTSKKHRWAVKMKENN